MWLIYPWSDIILQETGFPVTLSIAMQLLIPLSFAIIEFFVYVYKLFCQEDPAERATLTTDEPSNILFEMYCYYRAILYFFRQREELDPDVEAGEVTGENTVNITETGQPVRLRIGERPVTPE